MVVVRHIYVAEREVEQHLQQQLQRAGKLGFRKESDLCALRFTVVVIEVDDWCC